MLRAIERSGELKRAGNGKFAAGERHADMMRLSAPAADADAPRWSAPRPQTRKTRRVFA